jgi:hypothetical protein
MSDVYDDEWYADDAAGREEGADGE